jgi:protein-arginine kinase activator protein McsA
VVQAKEKDKERSNRGRRYPTGKEDLKTMSLPELNNLLDQVLESEDYIRAIAIRDEINSRNKGK